MTDTTQTPGPEGNAPSISEQAAVKPAEGMRTRKAFYLKYFMPNPEWYAANVYAKAKGTRFTLGRIMGQVFDTERRTNTLENGTVLQSVVLIGKFESENYQTGEISRAATAYLPIAFAQMVEQLFEANKSLTMVEIDCDLGIESTGKTSGATHEWVVTAFRDGDSMDVMKRLRYGRRTPLNASAYDAMAADGSLAALQAVPVAPALPAPQTLEDGEDNETGDGAGDGVIEGETVTSTDQEQPPEAPAEQEPTRSRGRGR